MLGVVLLFVILILAGIWEIGEQACVGQENEEICGTWLNTEYKGTRRWQKRIFSPDGTLRAYRYESLLSPDCEGIYTITEKWTDSQQNIWYKIKTDGKCHGEQVVYYYLIRITDSGKTLELVYHPVDYHKELDPKHPSYRVLYRK